LIVSAVVGVSQAGPYAIALAISSMQVMLPRGLATVVLPRIAWETSGPSRSSDVFARSSRHAVIISCATGMAVLAASPLIPLVYGPGFDDAIELTLILIPGSAAYGIAAVLTAGIIGQGRSTFPLVSALVIAPPTVAAYIAGAKAFGATGAAVASSASYVITGLVAVAYSVRVTGVPARELLMPCREDWRAYGQLVRRG
jgi:O-antigen/teichoic acid export membrane protein